MSDIDTVQKEKSTILQLYAIFVVSLLMGFYPNDMAQLVSFVFLFALVLGVPIYQWRAPEGSLLENHMMYLNRTLWLGSTFFLLSILAFGLWVYLQSDSTSFFSLFMQIKSGFIITEEDIRATFTEFLDTNMILLIQASVLCLVPPIAYLGWRIIKPLSRALKGHRMADPRAWL